MSIATRKLLMTTLLAALAMTTYAQTSTPDASTSAAATPAQGSKETQPPPRRLCARPEYPKDALRAGATGTSTISFLIGTDGSVLDAKVLKSSGSASLDDAALTALSKCQFRPGTENGKPVQTWQPVQYVWSIQ